MSQKYIKLARDINQSRIKIHQVNIIICPNPPLTIKIDAIVEEQDTALVLGKPTKIIDTENKPSWYLANRLESQTLLEPGSVIKRGGNTKRLLAIVHDLDKEPTWRMEWVDQALNNILNISRIDGITTIELPVLGAQYGRLEINPFLILLVSALKDYQGPLGTIWLTMPAEKCAQALSFLHKLVKN